MTSGPFRSGLGSRHLLAAYGKVARSTEIGTLELDISCSACSCCDSLLPYFFPFLATTQLRTRDHLQLAQNLWAPASFKRRTSEQHILGPAALFCSPTMLSLAATLDVPTYDPEHSSVERKSPNLFRTRSRQYQVRCPFWLSAASSLFERCCCFCLLNSVLMNCYESSPPSALYSPSWASPSLCSPSCPTARG